MNWQQILSVLSLAALPALTLQYLDFGWKSTELGY